MKTKPFIIIGIILIATSLFLIFNDQEIPQEIQKDNQTLENISNITLIQNTTDENETINNTFDKDFQITKDEVTVKEIIEYYPEELPTTGFPEPIEFPEWEDWNP